MHHKNVDVEVVNEDDGPPEDTRSYGESLKCLSHRIRKTGGVLIG